VLRLQHGSWSAVLPDQPKRCRLCAAQRSATAGSQAPGLAQRPLQLILLQQLQGADDFCDWQCRGEGSVGWRYGILGNQQGPAPAGWHVLCMLPLVLCPVPRWAGKAAVDCWRQAAYSGQFALRGYANRFWCPMRWHPTGIRCEWQQVGAACTYSTSTHSLEHCWSAAGVSTSISQRCSSMVRGAHPPRIHQAVPRPSHAHCITCHEHLLPLAQPPSHPAHPALPLPLQTWDQAKKKAYDQWKAGRGTAEEVSAVEG